MLFHSLFLFLHYFYFFKSISDSSILNAVKGKSAFDATVYFAIYIRSARISLTFLVSEMQILVLLLSIYSNNAAVCAMRGPFAQFSDVCGTFSG